MNHPALEQVDAERKETLSLRVADAITAFCGSMRFVYVHIVLWAIWIVTSFFGKDAYPFQFLTFILSLEAILLATFIMISQNRQSDVQRAKSDHDFEVQQTLLTDTHELIKLNTELTKDIHGVLRPPTVQ